PHCLELEKAAPIANLPSTWRPPQRQPAAVELESLALLPRLDWADGFATHWTPGEKGAQAALRRFVADAIKAYAETRDFPAEAGTSRLSPHLHFGEVSPRQVWAAVAELGRERGLFPPHKGAGVFLSEIGWREFAHHLLFHFNTTPDRSLRADWADFPWRADPGGHLRKAWQQGRTGYPIVDAGMRELWATGWMHN